MKNSDSDNTRTSLGSEAKTMLRHSLVYGLGIVMNRVISFLMIPLYTRYLVPAQYGILELLSLTTEMVGMLLSMRISRAMYRFYFEYSSVKDRDEVISTGMVSFGVIGLAGLAVASFFSGYLAETILDSREYAYYFNISFASLWFNTLNMMGYDYLQVNKKSVLFVSLSSLKLILNVGFNIYFIVFADMGVLGVLYGNLISSIAMALILVGPILFRVGVHFSKEKLSEMLKFGLPLIPGALSNFAVLASDRYFVKFFGSLADAGIYSLSYKFSIITHNFITIPFFNIWSVRRLELMKHEDSEKILGRIITYFFIVVAFISLGISALAKDTLRIITSEGYWEASAYIPVLALSYLIYSLFDHFVANILIEKKTKYVSYVDIGNGALNIILNIFLIKRYGIYGAAIATLISYTIRIFSIYIISTLIGKVYFEFRRCSKILFSAVAAFFICTFLDTGSSIINLCLKSSLVMLWPLSLYFLRVIRKEELLWLKNTVSSKLSS